MKSIFVVGDSISIQYGPYLEKATSSFLSYSRKEGEKEALKNLDIPAGANGGNSKMVLNYLRHKIDNNELTADYLLFNCGLHDIKIDNKTKDFQIPFTEYAINLKEVLSLLKPQKINPIWINTTPVVDGRHVANGSPFDRTEHDQKRYNEKAETIMKENNIPILDLYTFTKELGDDVYCDHVHFHDHIKEKQALFICDWLKNHIR